jgi:hypothetical protein
LTRLCGCAATDGADLSFSSSSLSSFFGLGRVSAVRRYLSGSFPLIYLCDCAATGGAAFFFVELLRSGAGIDIRCAALFFASGAYILPPSRIHPF